MDQMGQNDGLPERLSDADEQFFQGLVADGYRVTSPRDRRYNCVAYAADDTSQKWDCTGLPLPGYYWPPGARRGEDIDALRSAFESIGYEACSDPHTPNDLVETGYEKVALYVDDEGLWSHAAKQLPSGEWTSKLGNQEDVVHPSAHCFGGSIYGHVVYVMRRKLPEPIESSVPNV